MALPVLQRSNFASLSESGELSQPPTATATAIATATIINALVGMFGNQPHNMTYASLVLSNLQLRRPSISRSP